MLMGFLRALYVDLSFKLALLVLFPNVWLSLCLLLVLARLVLFAGAGCPCFVPTVGSPCSPFCL